MKHLIEIVNVIGEVIQVYEQTFPSLKQAMRACWQFEKEYIQIRREDNTLFFVARNETLLIAYNDLRCYKIER